MANFVTSSTSFDTPEHHSGQTSFRDARSFKLNASILLTVRHTGAAESGRARSAPLDAVCSAAISRPAVDYSTAQRPCRTAD
jgi:hypothetical protein